MSGAARIVMRGCASVIGGLVGFLDGVKVDGNAYATTIIIQVAQVAMVMEETERLWKAIEVIFSSIEIDNPATDFCRHCTKNRTRPTTFNGTSKLYIHLALFFYIFIVVSNHFFMFPLFIIAEKVN